MFTREGAADRKNGIVICDPRRPAASQGRWPSSPRASPRACTPRSSTPSRSTAPTSTSPTTAPARSTSSTSTTRRIRSRSARWKTPRADAGRCLHDIDVQDGLLYASYWNDGLVILDVGNGMKGGSPVEPAAGVAVQVRSRLALPAGRARTAGPGFIRGTHTAWRHGNYVFVADEVFGIDAARRAVHRAQPLARLRPAARARRERHRATRRRWRGTSRSTAACTTSGWRATRSTWARTTRASGRSTSRASCAAICGRRGARSRTLDAVRPEGLHAERADDVGRGGEERAGLRERLQQRAVHRADGAASGRSSRRRCHEARPRGRGGARARGRRRTRAGAADARLPRLGGLRGGGQDCSSSGSGRPAPRSSAPTRSASCRPTPTARTASRVAPDGKHYSSPPGTARRSARSGSTRPGRHGWRAESSSACSPRRCRSRPTATSPTS